MKKLLLLLLCLSSVLTLSGCSFLIYMTGIKVGEGEDLWTSKYTGKKLDSYLYNQCLAKAERSYLMKNSFALTDSSFDEYQVYLNAGKCLHSQGYVFTGGIFTLYCHDHRSAVECRGFRESSYK